jgi:hypothetical protein
LFFFFCLVQSIYNCVVPLGYSETELKKHLMDPQNKKVVHEMFKRNLPDLFDGFLFMEANLTHVH